MIKIVNFMFFTIRILKNYFKRARGTLGKSKLPHEMGKAKKCLFLESLSQAAEMECLLSKGSGSNREKSLLGEHGMNSSTKSTATVG